MLDAGAAVCAAGVAATADDGASRAPAVLDLGQALRVLAAPRQEAGVSTSG